MTITNACGEPTNPIYSETGVYSIKPNITYARSEIVTTKLPVAGRVFTIDLDNMSNDQVRRMLSQIEQLVDKRSTRKDYYTNEELTEFGRKAADRVTQSWQASLHNQTPSHKVEESAYQPMAMMDDYDFGDIRLPAPTECRDVTPKTHPDIPYTPDARVLAYLDNIKTTLAYDRAMKVVK